MLVGVWDRTSCLLWSAQAVANPDLPARVMPGGVFYQRAAMASISPVTFTIHVAWWFHWYFAGICTVAYATGLKPDPAMVHAALKRAVSIRMETGRQHAQ